jgi:tripartite-type tricarboxylate transporter receptor subunit TctC
MLTRRRVLSGATATGIAAFGMDAWAQSKTVEGWPSRPVRVVSPTGSGGPSQNFRMYAEPLKETFGQSFVLENIPGGSGAVGAQQVSRASADGHTLLLASNSHIVLAPLVLPTFPLDYKTFDPIALLFRFRFLLLASHQIPVKSAAELVAYAKARPGELNFGSPGVGTGGHLVTELFVKRTGIQAVHVPYQATTQQMMAAAAGTLQFTFDTIGNARGMVDAGKVVPLAVTGGSRSPAAPDIPTFAELGYKGFESLFVSNGLLAPKGTSAAIIKAVNAEVRRLNSAGPIPQKLLAAAYEVGTGSAEDYAASLEQDSGTWRAIVTETGVRIKS